VKDLEAKLKFIQEHVPTRISNVSGRRVRAQAAAQRPPGRRCVWAAHVCALGGG
jgi:hypothetical protein